MLVKTEIDIAPALRAIGAVTKQIDFATANALNDTAFEFRDAERKGISERMTVRREFVVQGIQVPREGRARRDHLVAEVEVEAKRDFLAKFEKGGTKRPRDGHSLAVPEDARPSPRELIPKRLRPRALQVADGPAQTISFRKNGTIRRGKVRQKGQGLFRTFLIEGMGIFQRVGRGGGSSVRLLYAFTPQAQIDPELRFFETARDVFDRSFSKHFQRRFLEALRSARV